MKHFNTDDREPDGDDMHPFHAESQDEPTYDSYPEHIVLDPPALCDEAAMQFSELLKDFCRQFDAQYADQIRRAAHRRQFEHSRREYERLFPKPQMMLPMFDDELGF